MGAKVAAGVLPLPRTAITNPVSGTPGVRVRYVDAAGCELAVEDRLATDLLWLSTALPAETATIELRTRYRVAVDGTEWIGVAGAGVVMLTADGNELVATTLNDDRDAIEGSFFQPPAVTAPLAVAAGQEVELVLTFQPRADGQFHAAAVTLGTEVVVKAPDDEIARAADLARSSDVAVVVVGTNSAIESEGFDRSGLGLPGHQDDLVRAVVAANPRTVVVVNSGSPVLMPWREDVPVILLGWFGGQEFGNALADVLLGAAEPGGRLPTTWPATESDVPVLSTTPVEDRLSYAEGIHTGYRAWLRAGAEPAFPFGHGLGYTTWELRAAGVPERVPVGSPVGVTVTVANTGTRPGRHVVQVYLARPDSAVERPVRWLAGFAPVELAPGSEREITIEIGARAFAHFDGGWQTEPGRFQIMVGHSVTDLPLTAEITLA
jgi:beta-glucosidase